MNRNDAVINDRHKIAEDEKLQMEIETMRREVEEHF